MSLVLAVVMVVSTFTLVGCNDAEKKLQKQIDELNALLTEQSNKITELETSKTEQAGKIAELESSKAEQENKIAELEVKNKELEEDVEDMIKGYKKEVINELQIYSELKGQETYSEENWAIITNYLNEAREQIKDKESKQEIDSLIEETREKINEVETTKSFPAISEEFDINRYTEEYFEEYALIVVPFTYGTLVYDHADFYVTYIHDGQLHFLIEISYDKPYHLDEVTDKMFTVTVPKIAIENYVIGASNIFEKYRFESDKFGIDIKIENDRTEVKEIEKKSIVCKSSVVPGNVMIDFYSNLNKITTITSKEELKEYFK